MTVTQGTVVQAVSDMTLPGGHKAQNVWYWRVIGDDATDAEVLTAVDTKIEAIFADIQAQIGSGVALGTATVHEWDWNGVDAWETGRIVGETTLTDAFAGASNILPYQSAAVITAFTEDVNRRSRKSFAGFTEAEQDQTELVAAAETALGNAAVEWLTNQVILGALQLEPVLAGGDGLVYPLLTALVADVLGTQRQRKPGVGI